LKDLNALRLWLAGRGVREGMDTAISMMRFCRAGAAKLRVAARKKRRAPALPEPFSLLFIAGFINMHSACPKVPLLY
jgi:hypothetical protein